MTEIEAKERWEWLKREVPEAAAFVADLYRLGMIDGLRHLDYAGPPRDLPPSPKAVTLDQIQVGMPTPVQRQERRP